MPREMLNAWGNAAKKKGGNIWTRLYNAAGYVGNNVFEKTYVLLMCYLCATYFNDIFNLTTTNK